MVIPINQGNLLSPPHQNGVIRADGPIIPVGWKNLPQNLGKWLRLKTETRWPVNFQYYDLKIGQNELPLELN
jgi:hypothetical protein